MNPNDCEARGNVGLAESIPGLRPAGQPSAVQNRSRRFCRDAHINLHAYSCIETPRSHRTLKTPDSSVAPSPCGRGLGLMFPRLSQMKYLHTQRIEDKERR